MNVGPFTRSMWEVFGWQFGWELVRSDDDGGEFRVSNADREQGYEYLSVSKRVRLDIDRAIATAFESGRAAK